MKLTLVKKLGLDFGCILALMVFNATMTYRKSSEIKHTQDTLAAAKDLQGT
jgi:hypothetical protein